MIWKKIYQIKDIKEEVKSGVDTEHIVLNTKEYDNISPENVPN